MIKPPDTETPRRFGVGADQLIGAGSESEVYALDDSRVLRVPRSASPNLDSLARRKRFLDGIAGRLPFDTPRIEAIEPDGSTVEKRLTGRPMTDVLASTDGAARYRALDSYFAAATAFKDIALPDAPYGNLLADEPIRADRWTAFLATSLARCVTRHRSHLNDAFGDADALARQALDLLGHVAETPEKVLAHGDFFPGNVLVDNEMNVSAVLDFSTWTLAAEPAYDLAGAVMFAEVTTECRPDDWRYLRSLLLARYGGNSPASMAFYRAYFAFTLFEPGGAASLYPKLHPWNVATLTALRDGSIMNWAQADR